METITANVFATARATCHTGPVYYGIGSLPYTAAVSGCELRRRDGKARLFKTAQAARAAIAKAK